MLPSSSAYGAIVSGKNYKSLIIGPIHLSVALKDQVYPFSWSKKKPRRDLEQWPNKQPKGSVNAEMTTSVNRNGTCVPFVQGEAHQPIPTSYLKNKSQVESTMLLRWAPQPTTTCQLNKCVEMVFSTRERDSCSRHLQSEKDKLTY